MATEMNKTYNPSEIEDRLYKKQEFSCLFGLWDEL